jgi:curved DNA-binding protein
MEHYQTLGLDKSASSDEIKKAYRKLASIHHPDKGGDTATFQKIQAAYETLSDDGKRQQYDNPMPQGFGGQGFPGGGFSFNVNGFDVNDLFGQMFNQQRHQRSNVYRTAVQITLEQAYNGTTQTIRLQTHTGQHLVEITIPKGIKDGDQVRYDNVIEGNSLTVEYRIQNHLKYERRGHDLYSSETISVLDLIVGGSLHFETISGKTLEVNINPNTQPFMNLKLSGQGMPIHGTNQYGNQILTIKPIIPDNISQNIIQAILDNK